MKSMRVFRVCVENYTNGEIYYDQIRAKSEFDKLSKEFPNFKVVLQDYVVNFEPDWREHSVSSPKRDFEYRMMLQNFKLADESSTKEGPEKIKLASIVERNGIVGITRANGNSICITRKVDSLPNTVFFETWTGEYITGLLPAGKIDAVRVENNRNKVRFHWSNGLTTDLISNTGITFSTERRDS